MAKNDKYRELYRKKVRRWRREQYTQRRQASLERYDAEFEGKHPRDAGGGDTSGQFTSGSSGISGSGDMSHAAQAPTKAPVAQGTVMHAESTAMPRVTATPESISAWEQSLSEEEANAIHAWTSTAYHAIRAMELDPEAANRPELQYNSKHFDAFKSAMSSAPHYQGTVFRGLDLRDADQDVIEQITTPGNTFQLNQTSSFAKSAEAASAFSGTSKHGSIVLSVDTQQGIDLGPFSDPDEEEVVVEKDANYEILSSEPVDTEDSEGYPMRYTHVRLKEIS